MRVKLTAAAAVLVAAVGLTGTAVVLSTAEAQPPAAPAQPGPPPGVAPPGGDPQGGGLPGPGRGAAEWLGLLAPAAWEYKFVDAKNDRKEFEQAIVQHGKDGWEFCASERFPEGDKAGLVLVFKKRNGRFDAAGVRTGWLDDEGRAKKVVLSPNSIEFAVKNIQAPDAANALRDILAGSGLTFATDPRHTAVVVSGEPAALGKFTGTIEKIIADAEARAVAPKPAALLDVVDLGLKNASAADTVAVLKKLFPNADLVAEPRTNRMLVRADERTLEQIKALVARLDSVETPKGVRP